jgi:hypothetical protein
MGRAQEPLRAQQSGGSCGRGPYLNGSCCSGQNHGADDVARDHIEDVVWPVACLCGDACTRAHQGQGMSTSMLAWFCCS